MQLVKYIKSGLFATGLEKVLVQGIGFAQGVILARLLKPGDFGLAAMLWIFVGIGATLAESGLGMAYIVYGGNAKKVFCWNMAIGLGVYAVLGALSPCVASFYGHGVLIPLMCVMGLGVVLGSICVLGNARLQRERRFAELSGVNVACAVAGFAAAILLATSGFGVWAIAWTGIVATTVRIVIFAFRHILWQGEDASSTDFRKMLGYGLKLTGSGLVQTVFQNVYQMILGRIFCPATVGLFSRAQRWATLPADAVNESVGRVALPDMVECRISARRCIMANALFLWPALAVLWFFANEIVGVVFGRVWLDCVPCLRILIFGVAVTPLANISRQYIRAKGRSDIILRNDFIKKPVQIALLVFCVGGLSTSAAEEGLLMLCRVKVASDIFEALVDFLAAWHLRRKNEAFCFNRVCLGDSLVGAELKRMHNERKFDGLLSGKSIAVVGNGPSELGKGHGAEIDGHDIVIRINNYATKGYETDYGRRTDVWMKCGAADVKHEMRDADIKAILYTEDLLVEPVISSFARYPEEEIAKGLIVDYIEKGDHDAFKAEIGAAPSSGALLIERLRRIQGVTVDVYGFSFLEPDELRDCSAFVHYGRERTPEYEKNIVGGAEHDVSKEVAWFRRHFDGRRLK